MKWRDQNPVNCSIGRTLDIVGSAWVLLVLREVFRGLHRFDDLQRHLDISPAVLSRRLDALVADGLLERLRYREPGQRARYEYRLTEAGTELFPVLAALKAWGDQHLADPAGPATVHRHRGCGAEVAAVLRCECGHLLDGSEDVVVDAGPGALALTAS
jgi:DNA-binding HxlR family transcriptional regulator